MNISPDGVSVRFKTEPEELFLAEKSGAKPNTVRIMDIPEADRIKRAPPTKIFIQYEQEIFLRTLTNICIAGEVLGKAIVIFSWKPTSSETDHLSPDVLTAPALIDDKFTAVTISRNLLGLLQSIAHGRTMNMVIRELYEASQYPQFKEDELIATIKTLKCQDCGCDGSILLLKTREGDKASKYGKCYKCGAEYRLDQRGNFYHG